MLRDYQLDLETRIFNAWQNPGVNNVMATMATGGGKSVVIGSVLRKFQRPAVVMAHRSELVSQLALMLAREQVPHGIIAPQPVIKQIVQLEVETFGQHFYRVQADIRVGSAHTLAVRDAKDRWFSQVALAVVDEGHHVTKGSVWERSMQLFPNARGLFKTAHAVRADGLGLGRPTAQNPKRDGLVDELVVGPHGRVLIDRGYLCDYIVREPPTDVDVSDVPIGPSGEFVHDKLREAVHRSKTIVGDIVGHYLRFAGGKLGLTFAVDIEAANEIRAAYEKAGIAAEIITAKTPIPVRAAVMRRFRARQILQLVSVDVLAEGVDVPAVEVVSLGRHTASWQLYCQQVGRALRPDINPAAVTSGHVNIWQYWDKLTDAERRQAIANSDKPRALVLDHVGNVRRHALLRGMFDDPQRYSLDRREKASRKKKNDILLLRTCLNETCFQTYEAFLSVCPHCGTPKPAPGRRGSPEQVEGELALLDPETLRMILADVAKIDAPPMLPVSAGPVAVASQKKNHLMRQIAQATLRPAIALWAGWKKHKGMDDSEIQRLFWYSFGIDVLNAQALNATEAAELEQRVRNQLEAARVVST